MFNFIEKYTTKRRSIVIEHDDVMSFLEVLTAIKHNSRFHRLMSMETGNCGWADYPTKWFVRFDATGKQWDELVANLDEHKRKLVLGKDGHFYLE